MVLLFLWANMFVLKQKCLRYTDLLLVLQRLYLQTPDAKTRLLRSVGASETEECPTKPCFKRCKTGNLNQYVKCQHVIILNNTSCQSKEKNSFSSKENKISNREKTHAQQAPHTCFGILTWYRWIAEALPLCKDVQGLMRRHGMRVRV